MLDTKPLIKFSVEHPWIIILLSLIITIGFALPLVNLQIQADVETLLPEDFDITDDHVADSGESFDKLLIMVKGSELFTVENLQLFEKTYQNLNEAIPVVQTIEPFSMMTLEKTGSRLTAVKMAPGGKAPTNDEELSVFVSRLEQSRFAPGLVSSSDGDALAVYLLVEKTENYVSMMDLIDEIIEPLGQKMTVSVTGTSAFSAETERFLTTGFARLLVFVIITILLSYYIGFRSKRAVFLPATLVISGTIFSLGIMALAGFELTMVSIISPPLILTLGSSYSIHVMNSYYAFAARKESNDKKKLIIDSVNQISGTVLLASLTTLIGLMSLLFATIRQTREFAVVTAAGIFFTALLSITLLPAFLVLQPVPDRNRLQTLSEDPLSRFLRRTGPRLARAGWQTIAIIVVITAVFVFITPKVEFNTSPAKYFPSSSKVIQNLNGFLEEMGGYEEISVNLKGPDEGYFLQTEVLEDINNIEQMLSSNPDISYIFSFPQYLEYASKVMTGKDNYFKSTGLNRFISKIFATANPDTDIVNKEYSELKIQLRVYNSDDMMPVDEKDTVELKEYITGVFSDNLPDEIEWQLHGTSFEFLKLSRQMRRDFLVSTLAALIMIGITGTIAFRSLFKGILTLVPLLMGIFSSMILMVIFNIPLDMTTIMVSCITIGVGVDDSIHFLLQHKRYENEFPDDSVKAAQETLLHTGRPILITTLSIVAGLVFLTFAKFQPIRYFGLLIVFTLLTACFSTLVLLPYLSRLKRKKKNA